MKKPLNDRIAAAEHRKAQIVARLAAMKGKAKAVDRKRDTRRKIVVGAAVLTEMERTPQFAAFVRKMLDKAVTRPQDREAIADLFKGAADAVTPAVNGNMPTPATPSRTDVTAAGSAVTAREKLTG